MIKTYYLVTKPGIIFGNIITVAGGFALASRGHIDFWLLIATLAGLSCVIASACVFNNYIDRHADEKMARTKNRALVKGLISVRNAILFASFLGLAGLLILSTFTNFLTVVMAALGFVVYVFLYSFWKYRTRYATEIGSIAGGLPPVVGYCAACGRLDAGALILFAIIALWQMPHFFSIALYRFDDYAAASIPVLPVRKGLYSTKIHMLVYIVAFTIAALTPLLLGFTGYLYAIVAALLGLTWLGLCLAGFKSKNNKLWARKMFHFSLVTVVVLCAMLAVDVV
jgi:protoheme IX farnesyltransferase